MKFRLKFSRLLIRWGQNVEAKSRKQRTKNREQVDLVLIRDYNKKTLSNLGE